MEDNCPPTPLHIPSGRRSKSPNQMTVSSPDSDGKKSPTGRLSPDSRCVICLGKLQNKSFTDSCLHEFCFQCLLQWSKVKPECPLCKQPFKAIIHNVRSNCDYDQYIIERREPACMVSEILHSYGFVPLERRFRYRSTMTREYFGELAESFLARTRNACQLRNFVSPPSYHIPSAGRFSPVPERRPARGGSDFRRRIYEQDLWVQDLADITGRYRECTPQFYRDNPAQIHRIIPWLNREINSLLTDCTSTFNAYVLDRLVSLLPQYPIRSRQFRNAVEPYFGCRTDHFIHELHTFARSVYDITGFDQNAVYGMNQNYDMEVQEINSSNEDSEVEVIRAYLEKQPHKISRSRRSNKSKKSIKTCGEEPVHSAEPQPGPSGINSRRLTETIEVCESDNDDVRVIEYVKPEPEVVVVSSGDEEEEVFKRSNHPLPSRSSDDSSSEYEGKHSKSKRGKRHKNGTDKGKLVLKGKGKKSSVKLRRKRSLSCSSSSGKETSVDSFSSVKVDYDDDDGDEYDRSSDSDYEPSSKMKKRKLSKGRDKKGKKSDRKSVPKVRANDLSLDSRKKTKVKSCVVVPSTSNMRQTRDNSLVESLYNFADSQGSDPSLLTPLPTYWSLMLDDRSDKQKRKRSKERRRSVSSHRPVHNGGSDNDRSRRGASSHSRWTESSTDAVDSRNWKSSGSPHGDSSKKSNSSSVKSGSSAEGTCEKNLEDSNGSDWFTLSNDLLRSSSSSTFQYLDDTCDESRSDH